jgi:hypothetical protein
MNLPSLTKGSIIVGIVEIKKCFHFLQISFLEKFGFVELVMAGGAGQSGLSLQG